MITGPIVMVIVAWLLCWWAVGSVCASSVMNIDQHVWLRRNWYTRAIFSTMRIRIKKLDHLRYYLEYRFAFTPWESGIHSQVMELAAAEIEAARVIKKLSRWLYTSDYKRVPFKVLRPSKETL